jgi:hypothetical protein
MTILGKTIKIMVLIIKRPSISIHAAPNPSRTAHIGKIKNIVSPLETRAT